MFVDSGWDFEMKPSANKLKMYVNKVFIKIPEEKRRSKWDKKPKVGVLLEYTDTGYSVLNNIRVKIARHCDVTEEDGILCGRKKEELEKRQKDLVTTKLK